MSVKAEIPRDLWCRLVMAKLQRGRGATLAGLVAEAIERFLADQPPDPPAGDGS